MLQTLIRGTKVGSNAGDTSGDGMKQEPNASAKAFFELLEEGKTALYQGCEDVTKLSFIVKLYQIKCVSTMTNRACDLILQMFTEVLPKGHCIPRRYTHELMIVCYSVMSMLKPKNALSVMRLDGNLVLP
jgi:hypothetical protein